MLIVGLTGGIGTGKSEVSLILRKLGAKVVEADLVGHEAYRPGTLVWQQVVDAFGKEILHHTGEIDRKRLGAIIFNDPGARDRLNSIVHPPMAKMIEERIDQMGRQGAEVVVLEAALLIEAGWDSLVDEVWVTCAPEDVVVERLRQRNHFSKEEIRSRITAQMASQERASHADVLVENWGSLDELRKRVESLWNSRVKGKVG